MDELASLVEKSRIILSPSITKGESPPPSSFPDANREGLLRRDTPGMTRPAQGIGGERGRGGLPWVPATTKMVDPDQVLADQLRKETKGTSRSGGGSHRDCPGNGVRPRPVGFNRAFEFPRNPGKINAGIHETPTWADKACIGTGHLMA